MGPPSKIMSAEKAQTFKNTDKNATIEMQTRAFISTGTGGRGVCWKRISSFSAGSPTVRSWLMLAMFAHFLQAWEGEGPCSVGFTSSSILAR